MCSAIRRRGPAALFAAAFCFAVVLILSAEAKAQPAGGDSASRVVDINRDWRFAKGAQAGAEAATFDDSAWQQVRLPHDWAISGPFDPSLSGNTGSLPWNGEGWYRLTYMMPASDAGKRVYLDFDGVMAFPKVYVNGQLAGEWTYGYMAFRVDATDHMRPGESNTIAVQVDTTNHGSRWYPGAGIYRKVFMTVNDPVHIAHWGNFITTPSVEENAATVSVKTALENHSAAAAATRVEVQIFDAAGQQVATSTQDQSVAAGGSAEVAQTLTINNPTRWDVNNPYLYSTRTNVFRDGQLVDSDTSNLGVRTFEFTATEGFQLNGRRVQIYGVNLHHDHGPLGAAFYTRAMERQLEIMKDMGFNFLRTSHNAPAKEVLDLCDRMGILVWDECFDKWNATADRVDGQPSVLDHGKTQLTNLVKRDRNHPSVVVWSIGNEIGDAPAGATEEASDGKSERRVSEFAAHVRSLDPSRPVTIGSDNSDVSRPILTSLEVTGWNYGARYTPFHNANPNLPILYSESASTLSTRGYYDFDMPSSKTDITSTVGQVTSYDLNAPSWADILDREFALMERDTFVGGEMVWTGFDYLGEPTGGGQGARSSYFGIVDLVGIPKDRFFLYRSYWRPEETTIHMLPHWTWPDRVGKTTPVFVYTNGDSAELFLNGRSLGRRTKGEMPAAPQNFAAGKTATASSEEMQQGNVPATVTDGDADTRWAAANETADQWLQVDLGESQPIRLVRIDFENPATSYGYDVQVSDDGANWRTVAEQAMGGARGARGGGRRGGPGGGRRGGAGGGGRRGRGGGAGAMQANHQVEGEGRYVRLQFKELAEGSWASVRELSVFPALLEPEYYADTYKYRLRWNDVVYEPGELKVVVYKDGATLGEKTLRTAGDPAVIRLTPDRTQLSASGEDLCYLLVEAYDAQGNLAPLADNMIRFRVNGPAEIAGIGNGNPLAMELFQDDSHSLFYGKAMLIVRTNEGDGGAIEVSAEGDGLQGASVTLQSAR